MTQGLDARGRHRTQTVITTEGCAVEESDIKRYHSDQLMQTCTAQTSKRVLLKKFLFGLFLSVSPLASHVTLGPAE